MKFQFYGIRAQWMLALILLVAIAMLVPPASPAQESGADERAEAALASEVEQEPAEGAETDEAAAPEENKINILELVISGGWLMTPIALMSLIVVAVGFERCLALRRSKIIPPELVQSLGDMAPQQSGFDPRKAYRLCQKYPSTASTVIRSMLLKVGRPHSEVEHAVAETNEREAARLYGNVRTLNLAAAITPLMGLLGTVWGMIQAFFATANLPTGANKAEALANGIYVALVTTAAGLAVAIPAAVLAHFFEGRIHKLLREIDELLFSLLPQVERFEGKLRVSRQQLGQDGRVDEQPEPESRTAVTAK